MNTQIKDLFIMSVLFIGLSLPISGRAIAQTFLVLHDFSERDDFFNNGGFQQAGFILSGKTLYGTTMGLGTSDAGAVVAVNTDGTCFRILHSFTGGNDGAVPVAKLVLSGHTLYGTTGAGGSSNCGTVFAVDINGAGFWILHSFTVVNFNSSVQNFTNSDGAVPVAGLVLSGDTLYGTAQGGGSWGNGTVFALSTNGTGFTNLHSFMAGNFDSATNSQEGSPQAGLVLLGNTLYGTTFSGGSSGSGTVFTINTDGTGFKSLHSFSEAGCPAGCPNSDGVFPQAELVLLGDTLYGTTFGGGSSGSGTVFAINTDGTGFTVVYNFTADFGSIPGNSDGALPMAGLISSGNTLYGTTSRGGCSDNGTVFAVNIDGTKFINLHNFTRVSSQGLDESPTRQLNMDGAHSVAGLSLSGNTLYGTTSRGGCSGWGTLFSISFAPQLAIIPNGAYVFLTWPTNFTGFDYNAYSLQSSTNPFPTMIWSDISPSPVVIGGQRVAVHPISGAQRYFRLISK
jgi:uncharacterized repeat protein (TIGR03803 family)